jgi:hypothetical protein
MPRELEKKFKRRRRFRKGTKVLERFEEFKKNTKNSVQRRSVVAKEKVQEENIGC